jgi:hypothetical protein
MNFDDNAESRKVLSSPAEHFRDEANRGVERSALFAIDSARITLIMHQFSPFSASATLTQ